MRERARYNVTIPTDYGTMIVNRNDWHSTSYGRIGVSHELLETGSYQPQEMEILRLLIDSLPYPRLVADIGANIGVTALIMAEAVGKDGMVFAFEPQRIIYQMLMGNLALNSIENVYAYWLALGTKPGSLELPPLDYTKPWNFGGLNLYGKSPEPQGIGGRGEVVQVTTLDSFGFSDLQFAKIDVEGMEVDVLKGAAQTIARCRPLLQVEWLRENYDTPRYLHNLDYLQYPIGGNLLCIPREKLGVFPLEGLPMLDPAEFQKPSA